MKEENKSEEKKIKKTDFKLRVVRPRSDVRYTMRVVRPNPNIDYKGIVVNPEYQDWDEAVRTGASETDDPDEAPDFDMFPPDRKRT